MSEDRDRLDEEIDMLAGGMTRKQIEKLKYKKTRNLFTRVVELIVLAVIIFFIAKEFM